MATKEFSRRQKALALIPLAALSGIWTASMVASASAAGDDRVDGRLPDGTSVPTQAIEAPANLPTSGELAPGVPSGSADQVVDGASTSGIPSAALSGYQRAAQIIDAADKRCHLPWELIAAIGRVESDHGRYGGNVLTDQGVSHPGIYGIELNGKNGTQAVQDTDGGDLDKDTVWDRAVGPMQFIPSTWQVVKVDADGDGRRNPQDIDDASLATAVYLCSGNDDVGTTAGQRSAVYRYNHSQQYVDLVLRLMRAYMSGDYTAVPNDTSGGQTLSYSDPGASIEPIRKQAKAKLRRQQGATLNGSTGSGSTGSGSTGSGTTGGSTGEGSGSTGSGSGGGGGGGLGGVVGGITGGGGSSGGGGGSTPAPVKPVVKTLNQLGQTTSYCVAHLPSALKSNSTAISRCAAAVGNKTTSQANSAIGGVVAQIVKDLLPGGLGGLGG